MSSHHQTIKNGIIWGALFGALVFLQPTPAAAASEENSDRLKTGNSRNSQMPALEPVSTYDSFLGLKITLKPEGGWNTFSGGDIGKGLSGMYDNAVAAISDSGTPIVQNVRDFSPGGLEIGGDLIYNITPLFGIGIGAARVSTGKESHVLFKSDTSWFDTLQILPRIRVSSLRAGLFYSFPFAGLLAISVHGGPALYSAEYSCTMHCGGGFSRDGLIHTSLTQEASARKLGFEGGIGFELTPNPFVAIFVEAQGRYANIGGLDGVEKATFFQDNQYQNSVKTGPVFRVDTAAYPQLNILRSEDAGSARRATLNFSAVSILAGLKLRL